MPKSKSTSTPAVQAPEKTFKTAEGNTATCTSAAPVILEAIDRMKIIVKHIQSVDALVANLPEQDDWGQAVGFCMQGLKREIGDLQGFLNCVVFDGPGNVIGLIEKGGER